MLTCEHIVKDYHSGEEVVHALKDVSLTFRSHEFVSILGPSGCGKTTFLNIIGGLDHYTSGDLKINGCSTKDYKDHDWDTYRNHQVGFVFQTYNLIMHQSVLSNVELALTLTGVGKQERRRRAVEVLKKVGLEDKIDKKPTQLSGGQMQRVAIARALINDPDILLADEPTGALDSVTSVQIMEILKEISKKTLVIMVTHNPELAEKYSTRIIQLRDGVVQSDSDPVKAKDQPAAPSHLKRPSMSFKTALSLSLNNLMTKKGRTFLTSFAGSIGIIGIALIISLSNGVQLYINRVENDTMAGYPIEVDETTTDMTDMMSTMNNMNKKSTKKKDGKVYTRAFVEDILNSVSSSKKNNLKEFKSYLESDKGKKFRKNTKAIEYDYDLQMYVYNEQTDSGLVQVSPNGLLEKLGLSDMLKASGQLNQSTVNGQSVWMMLPENKNLRNEEYELIDGHWATGKNEVVIAVDSNNEISDYALYSLGLLDQDQLVQNYQAFVNGSTEDLKATKTKSYTYDELKNVKFKLVMNSDLYQNRNGVWIDCSDDEDYMKGVVSNAEEVRVVGIIRQRSTTANQQFYGGVYYTSKMRDEVIQKSENSTIVQQQKADPNTNVFTGRPFSDTGKLSMSDLSDEQKATLASMSESELMDYMNSYNENASATYESNLQKMGVVDLDSPSKISMYVDGFDQKEVVGDLINDYNKEQKKNGHEENVITYNDFIGTILKSVTHMISLVSDVLIGFVSVSLVVSSIMIGIITYISVLERTKEIGILRAIGASKKDISRVFNAETTIIGLTSGVMGIVIAVLLDLPISHIIENMSGIADIAKLPVQSALILILISLVLTVIAGLIPARIASKKDPVEALRSE